MSIWWRNLYWSFRLNEDGSYKWIKQKFWSSQILAICNICFGIDSYLINSLTRFVLIRLKSVFSAVFTVSSILHTAYCSLLHHNHFTSQKMKFSIDEFFSKCDKSAVSISFFYYYFSRIRCKRLGKNITICIRR